MILAWALLGSKGDSDRVRKSSEDDLEPDKVLRRRAADKEIEDEFPKDLSTDEGDDKRKRRSTDDDDEISPLDSSSYDNLQLPYPADNIITQSSRFRVYRRTLINAEIYARKGDITTAISLFEGVHSRIHDMETQRKIDADIDYLKNYKVHKERINKKRERESISTAGQTNEIRFNIDGPVPQTINVGLIDTVSGMSPDAIAETVSRQIRSEIDNFKKELDEVKQTVQTDKIDVSSQHTEVSGLESELKEIKDGISALDNQTVRTREEIDRLRDMTGTETLDTINTMSNQLADIREQVNELQNIPETTMEPTLTEARFQGQVEEVMSQIPSLSKKIEDLESERNELLRKQSENRDSESLLRKIEEAVSKTEDAAKRAENATSSAQALSDTARATVAQQEVAAAMSPTGGAHQAPVQGNAPTTEGPTTTSAAAPPLQPGSPPEEDLTDFDLLSDYGKDKDDDKLTDEEIFEKILNDQKKDSIKDDLEILGETKPHQNDVTSMSMNVNADEEIFYKNLLNTNKRKTKELPILKVSYDFTKLPDEMSLSKEKNIMEYSFYKYKPMLEKAQEYLKHRRVRDAINYYKVVLNQNIPPEFKIMVRQNIKDLTDYLERYLTGD